MQLKWTNVFRKRAWEHVEKNFFNENFKFNLCVSLPISRFLFRLTHVWHHIFNSNVNALVTLLLPRMSLKVAMITRAFIWKAFRKHSNWKRNFKEFLINEKISLNGQKVLSNEDLEIVMWFVACGMSIGAFLMEISHVWIKGIIRQVTGMMALH